MVYKGKKLARRESHVVIEERDAEQALLYIRPATPQLARRYTLLAIDACNDAELLPPQYSMELADRTALKAKIRDTEDEGLTGPPQREDRNW